MMRISGFRFQIPDSRSRDARRRRPGLIAIVVIVVLALIALVGGGLLTMGAARRARARIEERQVQADWLAESGLERAAAKLAASGEYRGETWTIPADELGGRAGATVRIAVEPDSDRPGRRRVEVRAEYPSGGEGAARRSKRAVVAAGPQDKGEEAR